MQKRLRGQSVGLDRVAILAVAKQLLAESGATGLSMRAIASRLGVTPNALYNHFEDKTDLIDALLDQTLGEVQIPQDTPSRDSVVTIMTSSYDVLASHGVLVPLYLERRGARGPNAVALGDHVVGALLSLGLDMEPANQVLHVLIVQTIGFTAYGATAADLPANRAAFVRSLNWSLDGALAAAGT